MTFSWTAVAGATSYRLTQGSQSGNNATIVGPVLPASTLQTTLNIAVHQIDWSDTRFFVSACDGTRCVDSNVVDGIELASQAITYLKASNPSNNDRFGRSVAISGDGNVIAIGSDGEDSSAQGVNGNQDDEGAQNAGAVYIYTRTSTGWAQQAYLKGSNTDGSDNFGNDLALNHDGSVLVVGAPGESSSGVGVNGSQDQAMPAPDRIGSGAAYVFRRSGATWSQHAYLKASNPGAASFFGLSVTIDGEGRTIVVGAWGENSASRLVNGDQADVSAPDAGAAYVFVADGESWSQQSYLKASNAEAGDNFGINVQLSGDGTTLAVAAVKESSAATGYNGNQQDNSRTNSGAVYIFERGSSAWAQSAYLKASNTDALDFFGIGMALSHNGGVLAVGAPSESSNSEGINSNESDNSKTAAGAVYVFMRASSAWTQHAYVKPSNTNAMPPGMFFGDVVALNADGTKLAVGAWGESGAGVGLDANETDARATAAGAVYYFERSITTPFEQRNYVKAPNAQAGDYFGYGVALSASGDVLVVTARQEDGRSGGVDGNQGDDETDAANIGAAYVF